MKKLLFYGLILLVLGPAHAQMTLQQGNEVLARQLAATITADELRTHLLVLADDDMEGRETGTPGQARAADYLADVFAGMGLPPVVNGDSYFQRIIFLADNWETLQLSFNGKPLQHLRDFYALPNQNNSRDEVKAAEVTFLGYGIDDERYSDYKGEDVRGKTIFILSGEPVDKRGNYRLTGNTTPSEWSLEVERKLRAASQHGAATVIVLDGDYKNGMSIARQINLDSRMRMLQQENSTADLANNIFISTETARGLLGEHYDEVVKARKKIQKSGKSRSLTFPAAISLTQTKRVNQLMGSNVLGFVAGSDPNLANEVVIVTAHYDHIGRRGDNIFNGANDNASGTSTVLEICEAFVQARQSGQGPRRSVLFMLVSGEEKGLLGSQYYVEYPVFPLENTIANVNIDMVGRVDEQHRDNPNYIYVIGSDRLSTDLHRINENANHTFTQLELDYTYNAEDDPNRYYYRSDHYNFAERGIPAIFYFNGTHVDYHRTTDTADKINFASMEKIARLVFHTTWELANRDERIKVDVK